MLNVVVSFITGFILGACTLFIALVAACRAIEKDRKNRFGDDHEEW